jgi:integrase
MNSTLSTAQAKTTVAKTVGIFREWLHSRRQAPRTIEKHITLVERWMHDEQIENLPPAVITDARISRWVNRRDTDARYVTRYNNLSSLKSFCSFLCARGLIGFDPSRGVKIDAEKSPPKKTRRSQSFTSTEIANIISCAEKEGDTFWPFAIAVAQVTGMQLSEIANLEWSSFSKVPGYIVIPSHRYESSTRLDSMLTEIPVEHAKWMFPQQRAFATDPKRRAYLSVLFRRLCEKAGVEAGKPFKLLGQSR